MPIEFRCNQCDHLLRTPDEAAGKKARCPSCKSIQEIPSSQSPLTERDSFTPFEPIASPGPAQPAAEPVSTPPNPFAAAQAASNPYATPNSRVASMQELARAKLRIPGIVLLLLSIPSVMFFVLGLVGTLRNGAQQGWDDGTVGGLAFCVASIIFGLLVIAGTVQMLRLKSFGLAVAAMVLAIAPITCQVCVTFPIGIWGLIVLLNSDVRSQFE